MGSSAATAINRGLLKLGLNFWVEDPMLMPEKSQEMVPFMSLYFLISKSILYRFFPLQQVVSYGYRCNSYDRRTSIYI